MVEDGQCAARIAEGYPSGQRGQTVNLLAQPSQVRILPPPPVFWRTGAMQGNLVARRLLRSSTGVRPPARVQLRQRLRPRPAWFSLARRTCRCRRKHVAKKRGARLITRQCWRGLALQVHINCGCSSMVEPQPSKLMMWVRFPSPAPVMLAGSLRVHCPGSAGEGLGG